MMESNTVAAPSYEVGSRKWLITITVITCAIMELIDTSIVNVATRNIAGSLGATIEETAWVITAYAISNIIIIPLTGFLSNIFGRKIYFTASVMLFTGASFLLRRSFFGVLYKVLVVVLCLPQHKPYW